MRPWAAPKHLFSRASAARQTAQQLRIRLLPKRMCSVEAEASDNAATRPSFRVLGKHFVCCAVPMVGFGFMDNTILIRAGDAIDNAFSDTFGLTGLECAACGQVFSDFSGVLFGGVIESVSRKFFLPPSLSQTQHSLRIVQLAGTFGAALGVVTGCILGMGNLYFMDLKEAERQKELAEMQTLFRNCLQSATKAFNAGAGSIWVVSEDQTMWTFGSTGLKDKIIVPVSDSSLAGYSALHNQVLNIADCYQDSRFNQETDKKTGNRTKSMLVIPVVSQQDDKRVIAVLQLLNKGAGSGSDDAVSKACDVTQVFDALDEKMGKMVAEHISIFLSDLLCTN